MRTQEDDIDTLNELISSVTSLWWEASGRYNALVSVQMDIEDQVRIAEEAMNKERDRLEKLKNARNQLQNISRSL